MTSEALYVHINLRSKHLRKFKCHSVLTPFLPCKAFIVRTLIRVATSAAAVAIVVACSPRLVAEVVALEDAPRHFRFYGNQLRDQYERVKTLKGTINSKWRSPVKEAVFYHDLGNQQGIDELHIAGDFIRESRETFDFTWDLRSDNVVSSSRPEENPTRYFNRETGKELVPDRKNSEMGVENEYLINSAYKITTSLAQRDNSNGRQIYGRSQLTTPEMAGSAKQVFNWSADSTFHQFLLAAAKQIKEEKESIVACSLDIQAERHTLKLVVNGRSGRPLTYQWVFDEARDFSLLSYETYVAENDTTTTYNWTFNQVASIDNFPVQVEKNVRLDGEISFSEVHKLSDLVVNEQFADDTFSLAALGPSNGDLVIDVETEKKFFVDNMGKSLISADLSEARNTGNGTLLLVINVCVVAILIVLVILRRRAYTMSPP